MEQLIEKYQLKKAQIAGAILEEEKRINGVLANVVEGEEDYSKIELLEAQADLYDALIGLAKAFKPIEESLSRIEEAVVPPTNHEL